MRQVRYMRTLTSEERVFPHTSLLEFQISRCPGHFVSLFLCFKYTRIFQLHITAFYSKNSQLTIL